MREEEGMWEEEAITRGKNVKEENEGRGDVGRGSDNMREECEGRE